MARYGASRGRGRSVHSALPVPSSSWEKLLARLTDFSYLQIFVYAVILLVPLSIWLIWFGMTYSVRSELKRVEAHLLSLQDTTSPTMRRLASVRVDIPLFATTMPESVKVDAIGLPREGFQTEVKLEISGSYDTRSRKLHLEGWKQVLFPYKKIYVDWDYVVPAK